MFRRRIKVGSMVTFMIPRFNRKDMISVARNSVLQQTYKNIEVVVVDDGSSEAVTEFLDKRGFTLFCLAEGFLGVDVGEIRGV